MVIFSSAVFLFGLLVGRQLTVFSLLPLCCIIIVATGLCFPQPVFEIITLIICLQLGYIAGLASTFVYDLRNLLRNLPRHNWRKSPSLSPSPKAPHKVVAFRDSPRRDQ
jgi:hypothetical protein